jgi:hypothetical protein
MRTPKVGDSHQSCCFVTANYSGLQRTSACDSNDLTIAVADQYSAPIRLDCRPADRAEEKRYSDGSLGAPRSSSTIVNREAPSHSTEWLMQLRFEHRGTSDNLAAAPTETARQAPQVRRPSLVVAAIASYSVCLSRPTHITVDFYAGINVALSSCPPPPDKGRDTR